MRNVTLVQPRQQGKWRDCQRCYTTCVFQHSIQYKAGNNHVKVYSYSNRKHERNVAAYRRFLPTNALVAQNATLLRYAYCATRCTVFREEPTVSSNTTCMFSIKVGVDSLHVPYNMPRHISRSNTQNIRGFQKQDMTTKGCTLTSIFINYMKTIFSRIIKLVQSETCAICIASQSQTFGVKPVVGWCIQCYNVESSRKAKITTLICFEKYSKKKNISLKFDIRCREMLFNNN